MANSPSPFKSQRNYILQVGTEANSVADQGLVEIRPPFTLEFDINRSYASSQNNINLRVFNLSEENRGLLRQDVISFDTAQNEFRPVILNAGYGNSLSEIAVGNITRCWSMREKNNWITNIDAFDAGFAFASGFSSDQYPAGTPIKVVIAKLMSNLAPYGVSIGSIGNYDGYIKRGTAFSGNTATLLYQITGGGFCIDNGVAHALQDGECLPDPVFVIDSDSGLLGTPLREDTIVKVDILFEPKIKVNQLVQLISQTDSSFNNVYRVGALHHRGMISEAVCGDAVTSLELIRGEFDPIQEYTGPT